MKANGTVKRRSALKIVLIVVACILGVAILGFSSFIFYILGFNDHPKITYDAETTAGNNDITIVNFNVRCIALQDLGNKSWFVRAPLVLTQISQAQPDIICFQEVTQVHQGYLDTALKGFSSVYKYRSKGYSEATPIYYSTSKFNLIDSGGFWLSDTPDKQSIGWGASTYRVCNYVILEQKSDNKRFTVFNTHLDHVSELARVNGIQLVLDKMEEFGGYPSMLLGDMNTGEGSTTSLKAVESFDDSCKIATESLDVPTFNAWDKEEARKLDYCFMSKNAFDVASYQVINKKVNGVYASDHYALKIVAKLKLGT